MTSIYSVTLSWIGANVVFYLAFRLQVLFIALSRERDSTNDIQKYFISSYSWK